MSTVEKSQNIRDHVHLSRQRFTCPQLQFTRNPMSHRWTQTMIDIAHTHYACERRVLNDSKSPLSPNTTSDFGRKIVSKVNRTKICIFWSSVYNLQLYLLLFFCIISVRSIMKHVAHSLSSISPLITSQRHQQPKWVVPVLKNLLSEIFLFRKWPS